MSPLTKKGKKILSQMRKTYGKDAEKVFYASINKGTITDAEGPHDGYKRKKR